MATSRRTYSLVQTGMFVHRTGAVVVDFGYAATPEDHQSGRIQWLRLAMTAKQARQVADDLRKIAAESPLSDEVGHA